MKGICKLARVLVLPRSPVSSNMMATVAEEPKMFSAMPDRKRSPFQVEMEERQHK